MKRPLFYIFPLFGSISAFSYFVPKLNGYYPKKKDSFANDVYDVCVIGGGILGCSTAFHLSKRENLKVLLLEKQSIASGASGLAAGIISSYGKLSNPSWYEEYSQRSVDLMKELFKSKDEVEMIKCGCLLVATEEKASHDLTIQYEKLISKGSKCVQLLNQNQIKRYKINVKNAMWTDEGYAVNPTLLTHSIALRAENQGVTILENHEVVDIKFDEDNYLKISANNFIEFKAKKVVLATGALETKIYEKVGLDVPVVPVKGIMWLDEDNAENKQRIKNLPAIVTFSSSKEKQKTNPYGVNFNEHGKRIFHHLYMRPTIEENYLFGGDREPIFREKNIDFQVDANNFKEISNEWHRILNHPLNVSSENETASYCCFMPFSKEPNGEPVLMKTRDKRVMIANGLGPSGITIGLAFGEKVAEELLS